MTHGHAAARDLQEHLLSVCERFPHAKHFVIGHSHGGNVVTDAVARIASPAAAPCGVVYLGTPHLRHSARDLDGSLNIVRLFLLALSALFASFATGLLLLPLGFFIVPGASSVDDFILTLLIWLRLALIVWLTVPLNSRLQKVFRFGPEERLRRRQRDFIERMQAPFFRHTRCLNAGSPLDEAAAYLRIIRGAAAWPFWLWMPNLLLGLGLLVMAVGGFSSLTATVRLTVAILNQSRIDSQQLVVAGGFPVQMLLVAVLLIGLLILAGTLMLVVPQFIRSRIYGFGREDVLQHMLVEVRPDLEPLAADIEHYTATISAFVREGDSQRFWPGLRLRHCALYEDIGTLQKVAEWIGVTAGGFSKPAAAVPRLILGPPDLEPGVRPGEIPVVAKITRSLRALTSHWRPIFFVALCVVGVAQAWRYWHELERAALPATISGAGDPLRQLLVLLELAPAGEEPELAVRELAVQLLDTPVPFAILSDKDLIAPVVRFAPSGRSIAAGSVSGEIVIWGPTGARRFTSAISHVVEIAWDDREQRLLVIGEGGWVSGVGHQHVESAFDRQVVIALASWRTVRLKTLRHQREIEWRRRAAEIRTGRSECPTSGGRCHPRHAIRAP